MFLACLASTVVQVFAVHWALVQSQACHLGHVMS